MASCKDCLHFDVCCEDWANQTEGKFTADDYKINMADKVPCANHFKPAADVVEIKHEKWKLKSQIYKMPDDVDEEFYVECPLCKRTFYVPFEGTEEKMLEYAKENYPYCNCGAKMDIE